MFTLGESASSVLAASLPKASRGRTSWSASTTAKGLSDLMCTLTGLSPSTLKVASTSATCSVVFLWSRKSPFTLSVTLRSAPVSLVRSFSPTASIDLMVKLTRRFSLRSFSGTSSEISSQVRACLFWGSLLVSEPNLPSLSALVWKISMPPMSTTMLPVDRVMSMKSRWRSPVATPGT